jgi:hypothetical protein
VIQRYIFTAVSNQLAAMASDPTLFDDLFAYTWGLSATEVAGIKSYFAAHPIRVQHGYAVAEVNPPLIAITLQAESQSDFFEGDAAGFTTTAPAGWAGFAASADGAYGAQVEGAIWEYSYRILCISENIDVTSYMYEMVKAALLGAKEYFIAQGIMLPSYTGMDLAPDPRYTPENLFTRVLGMRCKRVFSIVDRSSALGRAYKVSGAAIPAASPNDNGGVTTGVDVASLTTFSDTGDST